MSIMYVCETSKDVWEVRLSGVFPPVVHATIIRWATAWEVQEEPFPVGSERLRSILRSLVWEFIGSQTTERGEEPRPVHFYQPFPSEPNQKKELPVWML